MKKVTILGLILAGAVCAGAGSVYASGQIARSNAIGEEAAANFAYVDAGISPEDATALMTEFDFERGKFVYDVQFIANGVKYDYSIESKSGAILDKEYEVINSAVANANNSSSNQGSQSGSSGSSAASGESGSSTTSGSGSTGGSTGSGSAGNSGSSGTSASSSQSTSGSGTTASSGTTSGSGTASGGSTASSSTSASSGTTTAQISVDRAKSIALSHAGVSSGSATFTTAKLDRENGRLVYEIDFYVRGSAEYDYEIDASSGQVLDYSKELWEPDDDYDYDD